MPTDRCGAEAESGDPMKWCDVRELEVEGRGWSDTAEFYDRLPARAEGLVRGPVWQLSQHSAGICVRFVTDATTLSARWTLRFESLAMNHMPATGVSGLDLYVRDKGKWRWLAVGRPEQFPANQHVLVSDLPTAEREYGLYLPLYNGVRSVEIGLPKDATFARAPGWPEGVKPICFYGTSITQGGCASRPGMAYPAILGRWLDLPTINLGFSGNGQMESEVAQLLAELDPCAYVIDCLPNLDVARVAERTQPFVETLRQARPDTPIVLVESITYQNAYLLPGMCESHTSKNAALRAACNQLTARGVGNLHYVPGGKLLGDDGEATVDGAHPTDLGFVRMAEVLEPVLKHTVKHET